MRIHILVAMLLTALMSKAQNGEWKSEKQFGYTLLYTSADERITYEYIRLINSGISTVKSFFNNSYQYPFEIYVHPDRASIEKQWQKDWQMPDFKSECWMVASGIGAKLDMISPIRWNNEACEHRYEDKLKTEQLITHELFHVYHGQQNPSHDFSEVENIDWFVEGLATYASGQMDSSRVAEVKEAIASDKIPGSIDQFWSGKLRYGLSGSLVGYIDKTYGRQMISKLLTVKRKEDLLATLGISEQDIMTSWKEFMTNN